MARDAKLTALIRALPSEARFSDVRRLLEGEGWTLTRQKGSHCAFTNESGGTFVLSLVAGRRVKRVYLRQVIDLLGLKEEGTG